MQIRKIKVSRVNSNASYDTEDYVVEEEPLEIRICFEDCKTFAIVMRTPGYDKELTLGFLYSEDVINSLSDISNVSVIDDNVVEVTLKKDVKIKTRDLIVNSSCGVCGRAFLYTLNILKSKTKVSKEIIFSLQYKLKERQKIFSITGGLHAAALFTTTGDLMYLYEDVGRHNAVDKLIGRLLMEEKIPAEKHILQVSGRVGYEIVSKAIKGGIPIVCGISAPTSLSIEIAEKAGLTLIGFLRGNNFNIYTHKERIV